MSNKAKAFNFLKDNRAIILIAGIFFLLHLILVTAPPLDTHAWRQSDTAAVARNFMEESPNILLPRVDIRGQFSGITGMEFPAYSYTIFIFNKIFGVAPWYGRLISSLMGCLALLFFYWLVKDNFGKRIGLFSAIALATSPLFFYFSRNIQPDIPMISLSIISLYLISRYVQDKNRKFFWLSLVFLSAAMLVKLPAVFVVAPMLVLLITKKMFRWLDIVWSFFVVIVPNLAWYAYSQHLSNAYGLGDYYYDGLNLSQSIKTILSLPFWEHAIILRTPSTLLTVLTASFALIGLCSVIKKRNYFVISWTASILAFILLFSTKTYYHTYYSLPLVPPMALAAGFGFELIYTRLNSGKRYVVALLILLVILINLFVKVKPLYAWNNQNYLHLENDLSDIVPRDARVVVNGGPAPVMLYFSHRKGWTAENKEISGAYLQDKINKGAQYLVVDKVGDNNPIDEGSNNLVFSNADFDVIKLN